MQQNQSPAERRIGPRIAIDQAVAILVDGRTVWTEVVAMLPGAGERAARVVRSDGGRYGLVFRELLSPAEFPSLTGVEIVEEEAVEKPALVRTSPGAFGRNRIKMFRRRVAEGT